MKTRQLLTTGIFCLGLTLSIPETKAEKLPSGNTPVNKPNIIVVLADDMGYECVGANGGASYQTPTLDKMAQQGIRFEHCYAQPLCTPSRCQIMTGIYNVRNYTGWARLDPSQTTFANLLKKAGYTTCMAGKWQLGEPFITVLPPHYGFDESYLQPDKNLYWGASLYINGTFKQSPKEAYGPDLVSDLACQFIEKNKAKPFFLYYTIYLPHDPWLPTPDSGVPDAWQLGSDHKKSSPKYFPDDIKYLDKLMGKLMAKLDELGVRENTLVLFVGDNGTGVGIKSVLNNVTVAGGKGEMTDAGTHVPMIASWPAGIRKPGVCKDMVDLTDYLPTICEAAGAEVPAALKIDGHSFLPQLRGEAGNPRPWSYCWFAKSPNIDTPQEWARNQRYKLYRTGEFYDVSEDTLEKHPLTTLSPEAQAARNLLQQALDKYQNARPAELAAKEAEIRSKAAPKKKSQTAE